MKHTQIILAALACALTTLPTQAQTPPAHNETIFLRHVIPSEVIKTMHWDKAANLPKGVKFVAPDAKTNALIVRADASGLAKVQDIARALDIKPRQVQIQSYFVRASRADLDASGIDVALVPQPTPEGGDKNAPPRFAQTASGSAVADFFKKLAADKRHIAQAPTITTTNNVRAQIAINQSFLAANPDGTTPPQVVSRTALDVTARINADHSLTLSFTAMYGSPADKIPPLTGLRTVKDGEMLLLAGALPDAAGNLLVLFLTPTALTDDKPDAKP